MPWNKSIKVIKPKRNRWMFKQLGKLARFIFLITAICLASKYFPESKELQTACIASGVLWLLFVSVSTWYQSWIWSKAFESGDEAKSKPVPFSSLLIGKMLSVV